MYAAITATTFSGIPIRNVLTRWNRLPDVFGIAGLAGITGITEFAAKFKKVAAAPTTTICLRSLFEFGDAGR